jgi:hypothetical protein
MRGFLSSASPWTLVYPRSSPWPHVISDGGNRRHNAGITLFDKARTAVSAVTLEEFENGGTASVVRHGYESPFTGHYPAAAEGWKVVARAEFLLKLQPRLPYNLIGHNCEIIANMCASGSWTESYQTRRFFTVRTAIDIPSCSTSLASAAGSYQSLGG